MKLIDIKDNHNVLMLRYEDFVNDFEIIFSEIEKFFYIKIPFETRNVITARYQIKAVEKIVESMGTFAEFNKITHWHGKHISNYKGRPFYYKEYFQDEQIVYLENVFKEFLLEFNYI